MIDLSEEETSTHKARRRVADDIEFVDLEPKRKRQRVNYTEEVMTEQLSCDDDEFMTESAQD